MSTTTINTHYGKNIKWTVYRNGYNAFVGTLTLDGSAYDISSRVFTAYIRTPQGTDNKLTLTEGSGITNGGATGLLTIALTEAQLATLPRDRYFIVVEYTIDSKDYPLIQGYIETSSETNPGTTTTSATIPVSINGETVSMAVTLAGASVTSSSIATALGVQTANVIYAGPSSGDSAAPEFRALVAGDVPDLSGTYQSVKAYTAIAYVDSNGVDATGVIGRADKPFLTINGALDAGAAITNLKIKVGMGTYASPTPAKVRANLWIEGSGKPGYNWTISQTSYAAFTITDPTALKGGTILQGNFQAIDKSNIHISNLGVDCGSAYVTSGGTEGNCIGIGSLTTTAPFPMITNIVIKNVTLLGRTAASLFHCLVMENVYEPVVENVDTYFATHGIALKGIGGTLTNTRGHKHSTDGIILKSDSYAFNWNTRVSNFEVKDSGIGLAIEFATGGVANGQLSCYNGHVIACTTGVKAYGAGGTNDSVHLDQIRSVSSTSHGFDIQASGYMLVSNCISRASGGAGFYVRNAGTAIFNSLVNCSSIQSTSYGFDVSAAVNQIIVENIKAVSSSTFGILAGSNIFGNSYRGINNTSGLLSGTITA